MRREGCMYICYATEMVQMEREDMEGLGKWHELSRILDSIPDIYKEMKEERN
jgi:hypothetical protein